MSGRLSVPDAAIAVESEALGPFLNRLDNLPPGYTQGLFRGARWGVSIRRSEDGRRSWLYAEDLAGADIVSFNLYVMNGDRVTLKPCEMSSRKVVDFVLGFAPVIETQAEINA